MLVRAAGFVFALFSIVSCEQEDRFPRMGLRNGDSVFVEYIGSIYFTEGDNDRTTLRIRVSRPLEEPWATDHDAADRIFADFAGEILAWRGAERVLISLFETPRKLGVSQRTSHSFGYEIIEGGAWVHLGERVGPPPPEPLERKSLTSGRDVDVLWRGRRRGPWTDYAAATLEVAYASGNVSEEDALGDALELMREFAGETDLALEVGLVVLLRRRPVSSRFDFPKFAVVYYQPSEDGVWNPLMEDLDAALLDHSSDQDGE